MSCTDPGPAKACPVVKPVLFPLHVSGLETADLKPHQSPSYSREDASCLNKHIDR